MKYFYRLFIWLTIIIVPVILTLLPVRILLSPIYISVVYRLPGFPEDSYGFSFDERLYWADISRQYLLNRESIDFLADRKIDDNIPLYNQRELRHMDDVKVIVRGAMVFLYSSIFFLLVVGIWSRSTGRWKDFTNAITTGGWLTVGLILLIFVYLIINFRSLFTNFHRIFFEGDTWLFQYSDTLIRLFPMRFWRDAFIWIGSIALIVGWALGYFGTKSKQK
jgi:integral membrane protein (TIGR01906 family)